MSKNDRRVYYYLGTDCDVCTEGALLHLSTPNNHWPTFALQVATFNSASCPQAFRDTRSKPVHGTVYVPTVLYPTLAARPTDLN